MGSPEGGRWTDPGRPALTAAAPSGSPVGSTAAPADEPPDAFLSAASFVELPSGHCGFVSMDAMEAEQLMSEREEGSFCLRRSSIGKLFLTVKLRGKVLHDIVEASGTGLICRNVSGDIQRILVAFGPRYTRPVLPMRPQYDEGRDFFVFIRAHFVTETWMTKCFPALLERGQRLADVVALAAAKLETHPDACDAVSFWTLQSSGRQRLTVTRDLPLTDSTLQSVENGFLEVVFRVARWRQSNSAPDPTLPLSLALSTEVAARTRESRSPQQAWPQRAVVRLARSPSPQIVYPNTQSPLLLETSRQRSPSPRLLPSSRIVSGSVMRMHSPRMSPRPQPRPGPGIAQPVSAPVVSIKRSPARVASAKSIKATLALRRNEPEVKTGQKGE